MCGGENLLTAICLLNPPVAIYIHRATNPNVLLTFVFICYTHTNDKPHISVCSSSSTPPTMWDSGSLTTGRAGGSLTYKSMLTHLHKAAKPHGDPMEI